MPAVAGVSAETLPRTSISPSEAAGAPAGAPVCDDLAGVERAVVVDLDLDLDGVADPGADCRTRRGRAALFGAFSVTPEQAAARVDDRLPPGEAHDRALHDGRWARPFERDA